MCTYTHVDNAHRRLNDHFLAMVRQFHETFALFFYKALFT